ncbi:putative deleted in malignant brain tumors 1 protein, partial [Triplophysa rosa]
ENLEAEQTAWLSAIGCTGFESSLMDCENNLWGAYSCKRYAGVVCRSKTRLVNGVDSCSGRVEVLQDDTWGTVCDGDWDLSDAAVVCREVGCGDAVEAKRGAYFGEGSGPIRMNNVTCVGDESILSACSVPSVSSCDHTMDVGVICRPVVRLASNGFDFCSGRVEVLHKGIWGTVCDDTWGFLDGQVVCRELGCGDFQVIPSSDYFGETLKQMWMDNVDCLGSEPLLSTCHFDGWGDYFCLLSVTAGLICGHPVRLVNGFDSCSGRVEVYHDGQWGTVCDDDWDLSDAAVVCKELGCGPYIEPRGGAYFGQGTGPVWMTGVSCVGSESTLMKCDSTGWRSNQCGHRYDAGVICSDTFVQKDNKVLVRIEVKAGPEVDPNYDSIKNALLEEMQKKMKTSDTFSMRWTTQSDGSVFQKVPEDIKDAQTCN